MKTQIQPTPIVTGEKAKEIEQIIKNNPPTEKTGAAIASLFAQFSTYTDEDWVNCKECLFYELGDCQGPESDERGCYSGERMEED